MASSRPARSDSLETYRRKRDFAKSPEPAGKVGKAGKKAGKKELGKRRQVHRAKARRPAAALRPAP
jgi:hypothetical protein